MIVYQHKKGPVITEKQTKLFSLLAFAFCLLTFPERANAQVGNCEAAFGEAILDAGNVRARIMNNGGLFWRGSPHTYEVPKGGGSNAIFAANTWIAGLVDGKLRAAASRYGPWEFWSGPLDEAGNPPDDCALYDQIWEIRTEDITDFQETGSISENLQNWPWQLGAPVIDGDGNSHNYNLAGGDLPELIGDQRLWWIMNDRGNIHEATDLEPIGLEVHGSAFSYNNAGPIGNFTFYAYRIINKSTAPLTDAYFGIFADVDLGNFDDDYVGSDSLLHLGYAYNSDNDDEGGEGYGDAPPAIGFTFIESILADADGLDNNRDGETDELGEMLGTSSVFHGLGDIVLGQHYYNAMRSMWCDGTHLVEGGAGHEGWLSINGPALNLPVKPTMFSFSGDPVTKGFWTEFNFDNKGQALDSHDQSLSTSTGPFNIIPGDTVDVKFAIIWARGGDHLSSVTALKKDAAGLRNAGSALFEPSVVLANYKQQQLEQPPTYSLGFDQNYPNPFSESTNIRYSVPHAMQVKLTVFDVLGREVETLVNKQQEAGIYSARFDAGNHNQGLYFARIEFDHLQFTKRMVLVR